jgi:Na+/proline symporter
MELIALDWLVVLGYGVVVIAVGLAVSRRAGRGLKEFFLSGRTLPWWLLGISLVATTFSTDTPNLVTDLVRTEGVSQNWVWWAFLITGMCTVFFYARLWRRSGALTDIAFYELRYSGRPAAFLRGFRALYLGVFFNVMIMASVNLAAIKIGGVLLGVDKYTAVFVGGAATALYAASAGLRGVVLTDMIQFVLAMIGAIAAAHFALSLPEVGGLSGLISHPAVAGRIELLPDFASWETAAAVFIVPIAVQWWSTWYPGAEPGGGGYVAQRMLAARNERESLLSTLLFNILHYGLRPWPWILVALASLVVYPDLASITARFPHLDPSIVGHDLAYPAMLVYLPHGLLGLMVASLAAAYMSTISTHLNWGSSYVVDDFYRRFVAPEKSERHYVLIARISTVALVFFAAGVSLWLEHAFQAFQILLQIGAGTGLIYLLRWYWWRVNAWSEISGMIISFMVAVYLQLVHPALGFTPLAPTTGLVLGVAITTAGWISVTFLTPPTAPQTLRAFYERIQPLGPGWRAAVGDAVDERTEHGGLTAAFLAWFLGCVCVYSALFATGALLYGRWAPGVVYATACVVSGVALLRLLPRIIGQTVEDGGGRSETV